MATIVPLADELRSAISLLRKHKLERAANRLERMSQHILAPKPKAKAKPRVVQIVGASGRKSNIKIDDALLDE